ncbi:MAG: hypothetical protein ACKVQC_06025 [Elusimicrobiota bacterium]
MNRILLMLLSIALLQSSPAYAETIKSNVLETGLSTETLIDQTGSATHAGGDQGEVNEEGEVAPDDNNGEPGCLRKIDVTINAKVNPAHNFSIKFNLHSSLSNTNREIMVPKIRIVNGSSFHQGKTQLKALKSEAFKLTAKPLDLPALYQAIDAQTKDVEIGCEPKSVIFDFEIRKK